MQFRMSVSSRYNNSKFYEGSCDVTLIRSTFIPQFVIKDNKLTDISYRKGSLTLFIPHELLIAFCFNGKSVAASIESLEKKVKKLNYNAVSQLSLRIVRLV